MTLYRQNFPQKIIPKQHILEAHCITWIQRYGFGLALHGEQGGELIHATIAKAEVCGRHIRNAEKRMDTVLRAHLLMTSPRLHKMDPRNSDLKEQSSH